MLKYTELYEKVNELHDIQNLLTTKERIYQEKKDEIESFKKELTNLENELKNMNNFSVSKIFKIVQISKNRKNILDQIKKLNINIENALYELEEINKQIEEINHQISASDFKCFSINSDGLLVINPSLFNSQKIARIEGDKLLEDSVEKQVMVHKTSFLPVDGIVLNGFSGGKIDLGGKPSENTRVDYKGVKRCFINYSSRRTVHFTLNNSVTDHSLGSWNNCKIIILDFVNNHISEIRKQYSSSGDLWTFDNVKLSKDAIILIDFDVYSKLDKKSLAGLNIILYKDGYNPVEVLLYEMGYPIAELTNGANHHHSTDSRLEGLLKDRNIFISFLKGHSLLPSQSENLRFSSGELLQLFEYFKNGKKEFQFSLDSRLKKDIISKLEGTDIDAHLVEFLLSMGFINNNGKYQFMGYQDFYKLHEENKTGFTDKEFFNNYLKLMNVEKLNNNIIQNNDIVGKPLETIVNKKYDELIKSNDMSAFITLNKSLTLLFLSLSPTTEIYLGDNYLYVSFGINSVDSSKYRLDNSDIKYYETAYISQNTRLLSFLIDVSNKTVGEIIQFCNQYIQEVMNSMNISLDDNNRKTIK